MVATDHAQTYYSENGGKSWIALAAPSGKDGVTFSGGMPVMSAYGYYFDPADRDGRYIAMNDFCNWGSFDGGKSWKQYNEGNAYPHNAYVLLYDDQVPGKVWAGFSRDHDMPHWKCRIPPRKSLTGAVFSPRPITAEAGGRSRGQVSRKEP